MSVTLEEINMSTPRKHLTPCKGEAANRKGLERFRNAGVPDGAEALPEETTVKRAQAAEATRDEGVAAKVGRNASLEGVVLSAGPARESSLARHLAMWDEGEALETTTFERAYGTARQQMRIALLHAE